MEYLSHILNLSLFYVVLTVSLNLILGYGGMVSLAHAAFFCIGGYVSAIVTMGWNCSFLAGLALAVLITMVLGGILAAPFIRIKEEYVLLFTLAFQMVVYHLMMSMVDITGGDSGIFGVPRVSLAGWSPGSPAQFIPLMAVVVLLSYWLAYKVTGSPFGRVLKGCREDDTAVSSLGKNVLRFKVVIFMAGTGMAAGVGGLFAHYTQFINPSIGSLDASILVIAMVVLGGTANLVGSAVGAFLLIIIPEILNFIPGASDLVVPLRGTIYGVLLVLFMRYRPEGLIPEYFHLRRAGTQIVPGKKPAGRPRAPASAAGPAEAIQPGGADQAVEGGVVLEVRGISKSFGGLKAVDNFSISLERGKVTALVGPNGCGKTTAFNLITGFLRPDQGRILLNGRDITNFSAHRLPGYGIVRSWQDVRIFKEMTVLDNVLIAGQDQPGERLIRLFFTPRQARREEEVNLDRAISCLEAVGLVEKQAELARDLSYAEQKLLAIARMLASGASILLLDEPSSGVDPNWVEHFMGMIRNLARAGKTICLVEHNLEVVRGVSDTVYFMAGGRKISQGTVDEVMADPELGELYFGA